MCNGTPFTDEKISARVIEQKTWSRSYKTFFMLNSAEHEILNAYKYKNRRKFSTF